MDKDKKNLLKEKVGWCAVCYHLERIPSTRPPTSSLRTATPIDFEFKKWADGEAEHHLRN
jgi:hypothetical protein